MKNHSQIKNFLMGVTAILFLLRPTMSVAAVTVYPAPDPSLLTDIFKVEVDGKNVPAYDLHVAPEDKTQRLAGVDDKTKYGIYFEHGAFASFDTDGTVTVRVTYKGPVTAARLLPTYPAIPVSIQGNTVQFSIDGPRNLTLEINHQIVRTLHIFANPLETDAPSPQDPKVYSFAPGDHAVSQFTMPAGKTIMYFAPGMHTIDNLTVRAGQTVYIAGGAVVRVVIRSDEPFISSNYTAKLYTHPGMTLSGAGIQLRGRGIIDGSLTAGKQLLKISGQDLRLDGVILQNSGNWFMPIWYSDRVSVTNLKILGSRANSDGMDIISSRDVTVQGCFIRTVDDVVTVKSYIRNEKVKSDSDKVKNITVQGNTFWSETGHTMTIGTNVGADISTVLFKDNEVIHDLARGPTCSIDLAGSGTVSNVIFEHLRIDRTGNRIDWGNASGAFVLAIKPSQWESEADRQRALGKIRGVLYKNSEIKTSSENPRIRIQLEGASADSDIQVVKFENILLNGQPLSSSNTVIKEQFVSQVSGLPR